MNGEDPSDHRTEEAPSLDDHSNIPCIWQHIRPSQAPSSAFGSIPSSPSPPYSVPSSAPTLSDSDSPSPTSPSMPFNPPFFSKPFSSIPRTPSPAMSSSPPQSPYSYRTPSIASESMGSALSPAPSVYSLTDSLKESSFKQVHGRSINNHSEVYMLPADDEEIHRLDTQHNIFRLLNGGNYLGPVREALAGPRKAVIDLGTGTGTWAVEMAQEFPEAEVVGVDLAPIQEGRELPANCRIEVDDINLGMDHFFRSFDVVHARHICSGITDYPHLVKQISQMLRPGGVALFFEAEYYVFDANKQPLGLKFNDPSGMVVDTMDTGTPFIAQYAAIFVGAVQRRGGNIGVGLRMPYMIKETGEFNQIEYKDVWIPASPWCKGNSPEARRLRRVGHLIREDLRSFLLAGRPIIMMDGVPEAYVDNLIQRAQRELDEAESPMWLRGCYTWARKAA